MLSGLRVALYGVPIAEVQELAGLVKRNGGTRVFGVTDSTTHIVCDPGLFAREREAGVSARTQRAVELGVPIVSTEWLRACDGEALVPVDVRAVAAAASWIVRCSCKHTYAHASPRTSQAFLLQPRVTDDQGAAEGKGCEEQDQIPRSERRRRVREATRAAAKRQADADNAAADVVVWVPGSAEAAKHEPRFPTPFEVLMRHVFRDPETQGTCGGGGVGCRGMGPVHECGRARCMYEAREDACRPHDSVRRRVAPRC